MIAHLILASAALGVFVVFGVMVTIGIFFERWYTRHGRRLIHLVVQSVTKTSSLFRGFGLWTGSAVTFSNFKATGKLSSAEAVRLVSGRQV